MAILPPRTRSRAHWLIGTLGLVAFLGSGLVMHYGYAHLQGMDRATHLSFRSIHIYLLFSALLNLCVAPSAGPVTRGWAGGAAVLGSVLVLSGPVLLGIAFLEEPLDPSLDRESPGRSPVSGSGERGGRSRDVHLFRAVTVRPTPHVEVRSLPPDRTRLAPTQRPE